MSSYFKYKFLVTISSPYDYSVLSYKEKEKSL